MISMFPIPPQKSRKIIETDAKSEIEEEQAANLEMKVTEKHKRR
jgi:hypothetical protein